MTQEDKILVGQLLCENCTENENYDKLHDRCIANAILNDIVVHYKKFDLIMTQEDKELLLKDLSARLPYGVIVRHADPFVDNDGNETGKFWHKRGYLCDITTLDDMITTIIESEGSDEEGYEHICNLERSLPYLRPMSSMTEEEMDKIEKILGDKCIFDFMDNGDVSLHQGNFTQNMLSKLYDFYNSIHVDYRGLIELGLALEAPKDMYNLKEK